MIESDVAKARTEALFRDVNERIAETSAGFDGATTEFFCECSDPSCVHRIEATHDEYEDVRTDGATFLLAPGHADHEIESVVVDRGRFHVVEKFQRTVRATVRRLNPRPASLS